MVKEFEQDHKHNIIRGSNSVQTKKVTARVACMQQNGEKIRFKAGLEISYKGIKGGTRLPRAEENAAIREYI